MDHTTDVFGSTATRYYSFRTKGVHKYDDRQRHEADEVSGVDMPIYTPYFFVSIIHLCGICSLQGLLQAIVLVLFSISIHCYELNENVKKKAIVQAGRNKITYFERLRLR